jgi:hypothetical protein
VVMSTREIEPKPIQKQKLRRSNRGIALITVLLVSVVVLGAVAATASLITVGTGRNLAQDKDALQALTLADSGISTFPRLLQTDSEKSTNAELIKYVTVPDTTAPALPQVNVTEGPNILGNYALSVTGVDRAKGIITIASKGITLGKREATKIVLQDFYLASSTVSKGGGGGRILPTITSCPSVDVKLTVQLKGGGGGGKNGHGNGRGNAYGLAKESSIVGAPPSSSSPGDLGVPSIVSGSRVKVKLKRSSQVQTTSTDPSDKRGVIRGKILESAAAKKSKKSDPLLRGVSNIQCNADINKNVNDERSLFYDSLGVTKEDFKASVPPAENKSFDEFTSSKSKGKHKKEDLTIVLSQYNKHYFAGIPKSLNLCSPRDLTGELVPSLVVIDAFEQDAGKKIKRKPINFDGKKRDSKVAVCEFRGVIYVIGDAKFKNDLSIYGAVIVEGTPKKSRGSTFKYRKTSIKGKFVDNAEGAKKKKGQNDRLPIIAYDPTAIGDALGSVGSTSSQTWTAVSGTWRQK